MSPNMFSVTITSNCSGVRTSCMAALSTSMSSISTSGYSRATSWTTRRHMRDVSSTFALSTDVSRPRRARASSNARRAMRSTWLRVVLAGVEDRAVVAHALRAEVEAADELADDQQVDWPLACGPEVGVDVELRPEP